MPDYSHDSDKVTCPVCLQAGRGPGGTVKRCYQPRMDGHRVQGKLTAIEADTLRCDICNTVLLYRHDGGWVSAHRVK